MGSWRVVLVVALVSLLIVYEDRVSTPSCEIVPNKDKEELKVMVVANLLLLGSEAAFFRDYYLSNFFKKSFDILAPDMLLVLGDVSARGSKLTKSKWSSVLHQFQRMVGPFIGLPFHVILGDRDVGECSGLDPISVNRVAMNFPGLDSSGCGAFEINNITFVSLNSVALLCGRNAIRFSVEKVIERESIYMKNGWRENDASPGSGPVLLLHFPLHCTEGNQCRQCSTLSRNSKPSKESSRTLVSRGVAESGPYDLLQTLPLNATEYIFQALRPRMVFSAHNQEFCDRTHSDGTREITVPAMTWDARDRPGFVVATFGKNGRAVSVSHCSLARESRVLIGYASLLLLLMLAICAGNTSDS